MIRRIRPIIRAASGSITTHRIRDVGIDVSALATTGVVRSLLATDDDPDYDLSTDGSNVSECHSKSRIVKIDLTVMIYTTNPTLFEVALLRDPDNTGILATTAGAVASAVFGSDWTANAAALKKNIMKYVPILVSDRTGPAVKLRIRRKALKRAGTMNDQDRIKIAFNSLANSTGAVAHVIGRIWTQHA